jgi:hypothetical protein
MIPTPAATVKSIQKNRTRDLPIEGSKIISSPQNALKKKRCTPKKTKGQSFQTALFIRF